MTDPTTANILLAVPTRGSDPGTWDIPVNSNSSAIDGYFGGVQTISVSSTPLTLTAPAGTVTASGGPTQAQNAVLTFTGTLTADVTVTLPLPGFYIINNLTTTTTNKLLFFRAVGSGNIVAVDFGDTLHIYNDGTNVSFVNLGRVGSIQIWAGYSAMPRWVTACTTPPYLLCDGTVYGTNFPALLRILGSTFGGNGSTTFGVPDLRGRVALPYDGTGSRITVGGCGINGQILGDGGGGQTNTLIINNLPPYTPSGSIVTVSSDVAAALVQFPPQAGTPATAVGGTSSGGNLVQPPHFSSIFTGSPQGGSSTPVNNVQPAQVTGTAVIRAA